METTLAPLANDQPQKLVFDWTESEWFRVWLRLARHEPENYSQGEQHAPYAAAA